MQQKGPSTCGAERVIFVALPLPLDLRSLLLIEMVRLRSNLVAKRDQKQRTEVHAVAVGGSSQVGMNKKRGNIFGNLINDFSQKFTKLMVLVAKNYQNLKKIQRSIFILQHCVLLTLKRQQKFYILIFYFPLPFEFNSKLLTSQKSMI